MNVGFFEEGEMSFYPKNIRRIQEMGEVIANNAKYIAKKKAVIMIIGKIKDFLDILKNYTEGCDKCFTAILFVDVSDSDWEEIKKTCPFDNVKWQN
jgi:hypothetical protein